MLKHYYRLAKPGIIYGNSITALAAFLYASRWHFAPQLLIATLAGLALVIGCAATLNNILDRDFDAHMNRTKDRALVTGEIGVRSAFLFAAIMGLTGVLLLTAYVNTLSAIIALLAVVIYALIYSPAKRYTHWSTVIGSFAGAVPVVVGYTAAINVLDERAFMLFLILMLWQMPHFYAIAIYRLEEYRAADIPTLPLKKGSRIAKIYILLYIVAFFAAEIAFFILGFGGFSYLALTSIATLAWLLKAVHGFDAGIDDAVWARSSFKTSLIVLVMFCLALTLAPLTP